MFSLFFIKRPIFAKVISIFIVVVGLISINLLPVAQFPEITPPSISVSTNYRGGSADAVEISVTKPIEEQLNGIEGMIYMTSNSSSDGSSKIEIFFKSGYDLDTAAIDVQNRVALAIPFLPESVKVTGVTTKKKSTSMVQILSLKSDNPNHDSLFLSNFASINIVEELKRIEGIGDVQNLGEKKYSMRIWINPNKLSNLELTIDEITSAIKKQNLQAALGSIGASPTTSTNKFQYTLTSTTRLSTVKEFENIIIKEQNNKRVRLKDVAKIELGAEVYGWGANVNNKETALLGIYQQPGSNALDVAKKIQEKLEQLQPRIPEGISVEATYDTTKFVEVSIQEVIITLLQALALVLLVVYFFLQSFRTTIIPAIAIPVSLIGTFALLLAMNFSINTLTLFGLILAIGIVVDDAIVVVENVESNLEKNPDLTLKEATTIAMKEVSSAVISTTLVLLAVFIPVSFIPGISGALYQQFAMTISFAVVISSLNALTLSPALCATILKNKNKIQTEDKNFIFKSFDKGLERFKTLYEKVLKKIINFWYASLFMYALLIAGTVFTLNALPTGFIPDEDQGTLVSSISLEPGTTLNITSQVSKKATDIIINTKGVKDVLSIPGFSIMSGAIDSSSATIFIVLEDWEKRKTIETSINSIMSKIMADAKKQINNADVRVFNMPSIPGLSAIGGFDLKLQNLEGIPLEEFQSIAQEFIEKINQEKSILYGYTSFNANYPQYYIDVNRDKISSLNLKLDDVFAVLQANLGSLYVNDFNKFGKTYKVLVQADQEFRDQKANINNFFVKNTNGDMIPLSTFTTITQITGPNTITHYNGYQSIDINGLHNLKDGYSSGDALNALEKVAKTLPSSVGYEFAGMSLQEKEAGNAALYIFALALLMVFLFLAAQYESWLMPLMIMLPIPAVMFGALGANMMAGLLNDTYTQIGLILLIGMSSKNAILIVEFAKDLREKGASIVDAAIQASIIRLRAILMTIFSFLLGLLPLVYATGAGAISRQSLGTAVFGGMIMSTILTLLLTPVLFVVLQRLRERNSENKVQKEISNDL